jgi:hypothetical protein
LEISEQVISGQGIGVFSGSKVKRLLEDESLRELVCSKLNMGLEVNYAEDEFLQDMVLSKAQYRGYLKLLQACIIGLERLDIRVAPGNPKPDILKKDPTRHFV